MGVNDRIKEEMKKKGISQNKLAKLAQISQSGLSSIISGASSPKENTLQAIACALQIPVSTLMDEPQTTEDIDSEAWAIRERLRRDPSYRLLFSAAGHEIRFRPHDLRHTYCTRFLHDAGIDMHQAMIWLGHSDEKMILRVYDHVTEKRTAQSVKIAEKSAIRMQNGMQQKPKTTKTRTP